VSSSWKTQAWQLSGPTSPSVSRSGACRAERILSSVPGALLLFALGVFALSFFQEGSGDALLLALAELSQWAARIYALPTGVAAAGALLLGLWNWRLR
jgi:hypothetical protein